MRFFGVVLRLAAGEDDGLVLRLGTGALALALLVLRLGAGALSLALALLVLRLGVGAGPRHHCRHYRLAMHVV